MYYWSFQGSAFLWFILVVIVGQLIIVGLWRFVDIGLDSLVDICWERADLLPGGLLLGKSWPLAWWTSAGKELTSCLVDICWERADLLPGGHLLGKSWSLGWWTSAWKELTSCLVGNCWERADLLPGGKELTCCLVDGNGSFRPLSRSPRVVSPWVVSPPSRFALHYVSRFALLPWVVSHTTWWVVSPNF